jgi:phage terminase small subunit
MQKPPARFAHLLGTPSEVAELSGQPLTIEEELFALRVVELRNAAAAYRAVYDCTRLASYNVHDRARVLMGRADVAARINEHRAVIEAQCVAKVIDILRDLDDIATADPNELVAVRRYNCRHCHGESYAYRWRDEAEMAAAYAADPEASAALPDCTGGFGWRRTDVPVTDCPKCEGLGVECVELQDTTQLSPKAAKLYAGAKQTKDGIEIKMHDQMAARVTILKVLGAMGDGGRDKGGREVSDVESVLRRLADGLPS